MKCLSVASLGMTDAESGGNPMFSIDRRMLAQNSNQQAPQKKRRDDIDYPLWSQGSVIVVGREM